jgi:hypothetical protein
LESRDLSSSYRFLRIAEIYQEAKNHDEALAWAERGAREFPNEHSPDLIDFIAKEYHRRKLPEKAFQLFWAFYEKHPCLENFQCLKENVSPLTAWPEYRTRALQILQARLDAATRNNRGFTGLQYSDNSEFVRIFLWEKDIEAAWNAAQSKGCIPPLWLKLAEQRATTHPADATTIYLRRAKILVGQTNNKAYKEAIFWLKKSKALFLQMGQQAAWETCVKEFHVQFARKQNFIALLQGV